MIRKPTAPLARESATVARTRALAATGVGVAKAGGHGLRGIFCYAFALLWGFAALAAGAAGQVGTLIGVGLMAAGMAWAGRRAFAKAALARSRPGALGTR